MIVVRYKLFYFHSRTPQVSFSTISFLQLVWIRRSSHHMLRTCSPLKCLHLMFITLLLWTKLGKAVKGVWPLHCRVYHKLATRKNLWCAFELAIETPTKPFFGEYFFKIQVRQWPTYPGPLRIIDCWLSASSGCS